MLKPLNLLRVMQIHEKLKTKQRVNVPGLASILEISPRQVYRLMDFLRDRFLAPVDYDRRERTYYYTETTFDLPAALLTEQESVALITAHHLIEDVAAMPLSAQLSVASRKFREFLPATVSIDLAPWLEGISCRPLQSRPVKPQIMETIVRALTARKGVRIQYYSAYNDKHTERSVDVYHLTLRHGDWYAVAYCHLRGDMRNFTLHRIQSAVAEERGYDIPDDFDADEYYASAFGVEFNLPPRDVILDFDEYAARWIRERTWHLEQSNEPLADGGLRLTLHVSPGVELQNWILSHGEHVRVVAPDDLAGTIADRLTAARSRYR